MSGAASNPGLEADRLIEEALRLQAEGGLAEAEARLRQALQIAPGDLRVAKVLGDVFYSQRRPGQALTCYEAVLKSVPREPQSLLGQGLALMALRRTQEAVASFERAAAAWPDFAAAHQNLGVGLSVLRRFSEALAHFDRTLELQPDHLSALNNRGVALQELRRPAEALESFDRAIAINPGYVAALGNRGAALRELSRPAEAVTSCEQALALDPADLSALNNMGAALQELRRFPEAETVYRQVIAVQPRHVTALNNLGNTLSELGRPVEALDCYDQALKVAPGQVSTLENKGLLLNELGRRGEAVEAIGEAIRLAPRRARAYYNLSSAHDFAASDPELAAMQALAADPAGLTPVELVELHYALGKALGDVGDTERAFAHYADGARRKRALLGYDEAAETGVLERTIQAYSAEVLWRGQGVGHPSDAPVFVLGMPRSGTTLVEQILAGHPKVFAAGEIGDLGEVMNEIRAPGGGAPNFPEGYAALHGPALRRAGSAYLERIRALAPDAARITNKAVGNFRFIGLIHLAQPGARIVHVRRDPVDTCLSCFTKLFARDHPYSYDLGELGRYYRGYEALMAHWRQVLPEEVMLEVRYEDVVADLEAQARRIVAHCGLGWDPACLDFHKAERQVRTASVTQVRQPLYSTSVGRWKAYEPWLGPLIEALAAP